MNESMKVVRWVGYGVYDEKDFWKKLVLSLEWERPGVIDGDSGDDGRDELRWLG